MSVLQRQCLGRLRLWGNRHLGSSPDVKQNPLLFKMDRFQVGSKGCQIIRGKRSKQQIAGIGHRCAPCRTGGSATDSQLPAPERGTAGNGAILALNPLGASIIFAVMSGALQTRLESAREMGCP
jgi:hypothetical protein